jgi:hypothetical protein
MVQRVARKGDLFKPVLGGKQGLDEAIEKARELSGK